MWYSTKIMKIQNLYPLQIEDGSMLLLAKKVGVLVAGKTPNNKTDVRPLRRIQKS